jgi:hypothetical protein
MINPLHSSTSSQAAISTPSVQPQPAQQKPKRPEDTVQLSHKAKQSSDTDHDGDSHGLRR